MAYNCCLLVRGSGSLLLRNSHSNSGRLLLSLGTLRVSRLRPLNLLLYLIVFNSQSTYKLMSSQERPVITIESTVNAPVQRVWESWTNPEHITKWNAASDDWHAPWAENDLRVGGQLKCRMEAKDGTMGFEFAGTYDEVRLNEYMEYTLGDGRKVKVQFDNQGESTHVIESFEAEETNSLDMQRNGWQAILDNFKKYTEGSRF